MLDKYGFTKVQENIMDICYDLFSIYPEFTVETDNPKINAGVCDTVRMEYATIEISTTMGAINTFNEEELTAILLHEVSHCVFNRLSKYSGSFSKNEAGDLLAKYSEIIYDELYRIYRIDSPYLTIIEGYPRQGGHAGNWRSEYFADTFASILYAVYFNKTFQDSAKFMMNTLQKMTAFNKTETFSQWLYKFNTGDSQFMERIRGRQFAENKNEEIDFKREYIYNLYRNCTHPFVELRVHFIEEAINYLVANCLITLIRLQKVVDFIKEGGRS